MSRASSISPSRYRALAALLALAAACLTLVAPLSAKAAPPPGTQNAVTLAATPTTVTFGGAVVLAGQVTGNGNAGVDISLEAHAHPFAGFRDTGQTTKTDATGNYRFTVVPAAWTKYRVSAKAKPTILSAEVNAFVRMRVTMGVSDSTPARGQLVRFAGSVFPEHDGRIVQLQRRGSDGVYRTVKTTALKDAGTTRSKYAVSLRINSTGRYRVRMPGDVDHLAGLSPSRRLVVG